ncbi:MAG: ABC transporter ATP-binding protein [Candidatus Heimdallarchaeota archaeon]
MAFLEVENLYFKYNRIWVLNGISLEGSEGELLALVGPSGCGKTTLLRILVGILTPQRGTIRVNKVDLLNLPIEKRKIGYVPQNQALFPHLTVYGNLSFGLHGHTKEEVHTRVLELARLGGLLELLERRPYELSGGQSQRVALLRALAPSPNLILLDEPLSNVDSHLREQLAMYIRKLQKNEAITTLFVTHDLQEAKMLADRLVIMDEGKTLQVGSPKTVNLHPKSLKVAMTLGLKNILLINTVSLDKEKSEHIIHTDLGEIRIPESRIQIPPQARGIHLDPLHLSVAKAQFDDTLPPNSLYGEIIAIVPEPMIHKSVVLISVTASTSSPILPARNQQTMIRTYGPIEEDFFHLEDKVTVKIDPGAVRFYS